MSAPAKVQIPWGHRATAMVQFFSEAFFQEVGDRLAIDAEWTKNAARVTAKFLLTATDAGRSIMLDIQSGRLTARAGTADEPSEFKFEAPMEQWTRLGKGEKDLQTLVLQGRIKFRGPLSKLLPLQPALFRIEVVVRDIPKEF